MTAAAGPGSPPAHDARVALGPARRLGPSLAALGGLAALAVLVGLASGSSGFGLASVEVMVEVRVPRVLAGFGVGGALALAGALLQQLTRNALADPYVLGVSSGASVAALGWMVALGMFAGGAVAASPGLEESRAWLRALHGPTAVAVAAAAGAALAMGLLLGLTWRAFTRGSASATADASVTVLLVGVMIGSGAAALVSLMLALAPEAQLRGMVFWLLGDLNGAVHWAAVWVAGAAALALVWPSARALDWIARGEAWAATLGVPVAPLQRRVLLAAAVATGAAVATAGAIGFVGLVVPHALRLAGVRGSRVLLPASLLAGGSFLVLADALARTVVAPVQLPVGVVCAAIGVPAFIALLLRGPRGRGL